MEQRYRKKRGDWHVWLLSLLLVAIPAGITLFVYRKNLAPPPRPLPVAARSPAATPAVSATPTVSRTPLPQLDASDAFVRNLVATLSANPAWASWLATDRLVRRFVVVVDNVAEGVSPTKQVPFLAPKGKFKTVDRGRSVFVDPKSYRRYDLVASVIESLDPKGTAEAYRRLKPLIDQAYSELGYPDRKFEVTLAKAIDRLLETPIPGDDVALRPGVRSYKLADPELEASTPAQKQFMRLGPETMKTIQNKLRELREALALPAPPKER
jgi:hypothetical protein